MSDPVAWEAYWPGAGSIDSVTRTTHLSTVMEQWKRDGAQITPLVPADALAKARRENEKLKGLLANLTVILHDEGYLHELADVRAALTHGGGDE